jgi:hypothetical protein
VPLTVKGALGDATLQADSYNQLLDAFADGPRNLRDVIAKSNGLENSSWPPCNLAVLSEQDIFSHFRISTMKRNVRAALAPLEDSIRSLRKALDGRPRSGPIPRERTARGARSFSGTSMALPHNLRLRGSAGEAVV